MAKIIEGTVTKVVQIYLDDHDKPLIVTMLVDSVAVKKVIKVIKEKIGKDAKNYVFEVVDPETDLGDIIKKLRME